MPAGCLSRVKTTAPVNRHYGPMVLEQSVCCRHGERFIIPRSGPSRQLLGLLGGKLNRTLRPQLKGGSARRACCLDGNGRSRYPIRAWKRLFGCTARWVDLPRFMLSRHLTSDPLSSSRSKSCAEAIGYASPADFDPFLQRLNGRTWPLASPASTATDRDDPPTGLARQFGACPFNHRLLAARVNVMASGWPIAFRQSGPRAPAPFAPSTASPDPEGLAGVQQVVATLQPLCAPRAAGNWRADQRS